MRKLFAACAASALLAVCVAACGSSSPDCHTVKHDGKRVCVEYRQQQGPDGLLLIPIYYLLFRPAPYIPPAQIPTSGYGSSIDNGDGISVAPPAEEDPVEAPPEEAPPPEEPVEEPVEVEPEDG